MKVHKMEKISKLGAVIIKILKLCLQKGLLTEI